MRRQREAADEEGQDRDAAHGPAEQVEEYRRVRRPRAALPPAHSSGSGTARRIQSTSKAGSTPTRNTVARRQIGQEEDGQRREHDADVHAGLEHRGHPRPPALGPRLGQQRRPNRPLAADAERRQEAEDEQLPPRLREERQAGEQSRR